MTTSQLLLFIAAGVLLNLTPGPDVLYIVTHALRRGARAGMVAALGITAGCFVHIIAAALGVSALLAASATAFAVLKWAGAAYLVYVGIRLLTSQGPEFAINSEADSARLVRAGGLKVIFFEGFWTNVLNPKVALFFLAFVPQFIAPGVDNKPLAFLLLGLLFNFNGLWVNIGWALAASWVARRLGETGGQRRADPGRDEREGPSGPAGAADLALPVRRRSGPLGGQRSTRSDKRGGLFTWLDRVAGAMFITFGVKLALTDNPSD